MNIDWTQASTKRGVVWVSTFFIGMIMIALKQDVSQLIVLSTGVAGGLGILIKD